MSSQPDNQLILEARMGSDQRSKTARIERNSEAYPSDAALAVMAEVLAKFSVKLPADLEKIFALARDSYELTGSPFDDVRSRTGGRYGDVIIFNERLHKGVYWGLASTYFHLNHFIEMENLLKSKGVEILKLSPASDPNAVSTVVPPTPVLTYIFEAYTLMSRATLDRLTRFLSYYFKSQTNNIRSLETVLSRNPWQSEIRAKRVRTVIASHSSFLDTMFSSANAMGRTKHSERDRIAHYEVVGFRSPNIHLFPNGSMRIEIVSPEGNWIDDPGLYLNARFGELSALTIDVLSALLDSANIAAD